MSTIETIYVGELRTKATHIQSGIEIITDAPTDNKGKGESFSPTDLVATALGSCMLTIMGIRSRERELNIDGTRLIISKIMTSNPRRIAEIAILMELPDTGLSTEEIQMLEDAAVSCPVALSLHPELRQSLEITIKHS